MFVFFILELKFREDWIEIKGRIRKCGLFLYLGLRLVRSWEEEVEKKRVQYAALQSTPRMAAVKSHPSDCYIFGFAKST